MIVEDEWKLEQLKFLFKFGLCHNSTVGVELAGDKSFPIIPFYLPQIFYLLINTHYRFFSIVKREFLQSFGSKITKIE